jgi:hypothetical protein
MRVRPNLSLFTQTDVDSAALTVHVAVGHAFPTPGRYTGSVLLGKETVGSFLLDVDAECRDMQADIDLAGGGSVASGIAPRQLSAEHGRAFRVSPQGMVLFHVGSGPGGLAARVGPVDEQLRREAFDSRKLGKSDIIAVTLLRPGTYRATFGRGGANLRVAYPDPKRGMRPMDPVVFEASEDGLQPDGAELQPTQGQLYRLGSGGRLRIELVEPDDGPEPTDPGEHDPGGGTDRPDRPDRPGDRPGGKRPPKRPVAHRMRRP